ncbi:MAG: ferritin-like domain-containing protein [Myxococcota bacterium]
MSRPSDLGVNRTGAGLSPIDAGRTAQGAQDGASGSPDLGLADELRRPYLEEGRVLGSMAPPTTLKGAAGAAMKRLQGESLGFFLDLLGARLAFERTGVRLYEGLLRKAKFDGAKLPLDRLAHIHDEELRHAHLVHKAIVDLGGDPTVLTPNADVSAVLGMGIAKVIQDPRATVAQSLDAILVAERADAGCWDVLVEAARSMGQDDLASSFAEALANEERHVVEIDTFYRELIYAQLGARPQKVH